MNDSQEFDHALRRRHAEAITHLSARTQVQLRNQLAAAAAAPRRPAHRVAWTAAASFAALFALAIGLQLRPQPTTAPQSAATSIARDHDDSDATLATLDENPDLYVWLASKDAVALASE
ncbi:MAG TPA: hypothetical protein VHF02_05450 [Luteimonas sp.]|nr:hypothetical protein [Luteimonas sp.]